MMGGNVMYRRPDTEGCLEAIFGALVRIISVKQNTEG